MIDWDRVAELKDEMGEDGFAEILAIFLEETDEAVGGLGAAPVEERQASLHFLRGAALNLGLSEAARLAGAGEAQCRDGDAANVDIAPILGAYADGRAALLGETG